MRGYKKFYEAPLWLKAYELQKKIFILSQTFPKSEIYGLVDQMNRSANSLLANFAEADGRFHYADKVRVLYIARGELQELQSHLIVAASRGYMEKASSSDLIRKYEEVKMQLNLYIGSLLKQK